MTDPLIRTQNLSRIYRLGGREIPALQAVDLSLKAGQIVALRGRSGSGKTTLLNCISGLDRPTAGQVWIAGQEVSAFGEAEKVALRRQKLGFVFQSHALLPTYSAAENIDLVLRLAGWGYSERQGRVAEVLGLVGLSAWADHRPYELSGGQQQRVAIGRALAHRPQIILADEPTGELDVATSRKVLTLLRHIAHSEGCLVLIATHDLMVDEFAQRVIHLQDGRIERLEEVGLDVA